MMLRFLELCLKGHIETAASHTHLAPLHLLFTLPLLGSDGVQPGAPLCLFGAARLLLPTQRCLLCLETLLGLGEEPLLLLLSAPRNVTPLPLHLALHLPGGKRNQTQKVKRHECAQTAVPPSEVLPARKVTFRLIFISSIRCRRAAWRAANSSVRRDMTCDVKSSRSSFILLRRVFSCTSSSHDDLCCSR